MPKAVNTMVELQVNRYENSTLLISKLDGQRMFDQACGQNGDFTRNLVHDAYPDVFLYGVYSVYVDLIYYTDILSPQKDKFQGCVCIDPPILQRSIVLSSSGASTMAVPRTRSLVCEPWLWILVTGVVWSAESLF